MSKPTTNKRSPTNGFDRQTMEDRIKNFKRYKPEGDWRRIDSKLISMTVLYQKWTHKASQKTAEVKHICPWGMRDYVTKLLLDDKNKK